MSRSSGVLPRRPFLQATSLVLVHALGMFSRSKCRYALAVSAENDAEKGTKLGGSAGATPHGKLRAASPSSRRHLFSALEEQLDTGVDLAPQLSWTPAETMFSPEWVEQFALGEEGCKLARGSYLWRGHGFGSNANNMLNAWVYAIAVEKWTDLAVIINEDQLNGVECGEESGGVASKGWECLFRPLPHLCTFPSYQAWQEHILTENLSPSQVAEAESLNLDFVRFHPEKIVESLDGLGVDHLGALAVMAKYLWSSITPWLQADVDFITRSPVPESFDQSPFLSLHVRRGDKISLHEADIHYCEEYLDAAVAYLETDESELNVEDIKGIWVASDDSSVVDRLKEVAPAYLPNVNTDSIIWASGGVQGGPPLAMTATRTDHAVYADFAYMLADLQRCMSSDVFVGTFSSNLGRLLVLLRSSIGLKPRGSSISLDGSWRPG